MRRISAVNSVLSFRFEGVHISRKTSIFNTLTHEYVFSCSVAQLLLYIVIVVSNHLPRGGESMMTKKGLFFSATFLLSLILVLGGFIGCGSEDPAASNSNLAPGDLGADKGANDQDPSYVSSIRVSEDASDDQLSGLANITADQAETAALAGVPGVALATKLDNENGNVVYAVEIDTGSGVKEVKVDAGNGNILHIESDDTEDVEGNGGDSKEDEPGGLESNHEFDGEEEGEN
jgi:hypothetical protein